MPLLAVAAWAGGLAGALLPGPALVAALPTLAGAAALAVRRSPRHRAAVIALVLVCLAVAGAAQLRTYQVRTGPLAVLAADRATVTVEGRIVADPRLVAGGHTDQALVRLQVRRVVGRGEAYRLATPALLFGDPQWLGVPLGATVRVTARAEPPRGDDVAAVLRAGEPHLVAGPDPWWRGAEAVRASLRDSVAHRPADQRVLVPALVSGDDAGLDPGLADDFRATGLTHLLAVSGTNLTLVVGFLLVLARWCRVRGRWLLLVGALGIVGFVLLARTEPSVVRAATMGTVALLALGGNGRQRALRGLGVAVVALLLVDPGMATTVGFALSVLATAGILLLAPGIRDSLHRWLPRWLAEAVAVPTAAQLACTPVVAGISGQVSLVAVGANLLVAPVVGPATVLGLLGGLLGLVWGAAGRLVGTGASWCVGWVVLVAERGADLPVAAVDWGTGPLALALLTAVTAALALGAPALLRRRSTGLLCCLLAGVVVVVRPPAYGWPPPDWVLVACDVGQGDALVLRTAPGSAVVVDAGPEPGPVDRCLRDLGVESVPLLVLTHFHADHVDGLEGVLHGRSVAEVGTSPLLDPPAAVATVAGLATDAGVPAAPLLPGRTTTYGAVTLQVLWPDPGRLGPAPGDGSTANDASVVLLAETAGLRILLSGDVEPPAQAGLRRRLPDLRVDVLKVPHHGSRHQDPAWLTSLGAELALVTVGEGNDYGHPAADTLALLEGAGTTVHRTDTGGDLAVVADPDGPRVRER